VGLVDGAGLFVTVLWGFSLWWIVFALTIVLRSRRELHFHLGWWGFGFPSAAFVALTTEIAGVWGLAWLEAVVQVLWVALLALFLALSLATIRATVRGTVGQR